MRINLNIIMKIPKIKTELFQNTENKKRAASEK